VVRWVVEQFVASGCELESRRHIACAIADGTRDVPATLLPRAPTLRTAAILLDQLHGSFDRAVVRILDLLDASPQAASESLHELARYASVGFHLVRPWNVVVAGAPNVGKSSLVNALAGFQRAVVSEIAGTTRDLVSVSVAFDGWPVELTDTAGLREADGLEGAGVERANRALAAADLLLWVVDRTDPSPRWPTDDQLAGKPCLVIANKADLPSQWDGEERDTLSVSAMTRAGLSELVAAIVSRLVTDPPPPGVAVPYSPQLADRVEAAHAALTAGRVDDCARLLHECLGRPG
jgi:tRNA modification GTPase